MNIRLPRLSPFAIAAALVLAAGATPMLAQTAQDSARQAGAVARTDNAQSNAMKLSEDGFRTMHAVHAARVAIFQGRPQMTGQRSPRQRRR